MDSKEVLKQNFGDKLLLVKAKDASYKYVVITDAIEDGIFISFNELKEISTVSYYSDEEVSSLEKAVDFAALVEDACDKYAKENIVGYFSPNKYIPKV